MRIRLNLPNPRWSRAASAIPEIEFVESANASVEVNGEMRAAWVLERASTLPANIAAAVPPGSIGLVIAAHLPQMERASLQDAGLSWWDLGGSLHVEFDDKLVHIERPARRSFSSTDSRERTLGPVGTRAVQVMVAEPSGRPWRVSDLAEKAGVSLGQAHSVLTLLEEQGLLSTVGAGARKRRVLKNREGCLDWLLAVELGRRAPNTAYTYMYARNEMDRARRFDELATDRGVGYAFTSALGARLHGAPVLTNSVVTTIRVAARNAEEAQDKLGLERLDVDEAARGANVALWADSGEVGTHDAIERDGLRVAPAVRVWLDLARQGGRLGDGADMIRRLVLDGR